LQLRSNSEENNIKIFFLVEGVAMKRLLYSIIVTGSCVATDSMRRFELYQQKVKKVEPYHNHHFTQMRFTKENTHTMCRRYKHRDYTPKSKR